MSVVCRPFYLPRELTVVIITTVYIPPDANISIALTTYMIVSINSSKLILITSSLGILIKHA